MTDFKVTPGAVRNGANKFKGQGEALKGRAAAIESPSPMMMGLFMAPFLSAALPMLTEILRRSVDGSGNGYDVIGGKLENSSKAYEDAETEWSKLSAGIKIGD